MTTTPADDRTHADRITESMKRRGLLAAAWAAMAAVILNRTTQPVEAGVDGDVVLGSPNSTATATTITNTTGAASLAFGAACVPGTSGVGLEGVGSGYGVVGQTGLTGIAGGAGVVGVTERPNTFGVLGINGQPGGTAVLGQSLSFNGVMGQIPSSSNQNAIAIYGQNYSTYAGPGPGAGGFGVYGLSANGHGLVGATATAGGAAVVGATNGVAGAYAGAFYGPVIVSGSLTVFGAKSAAVPHPDGTHRRLYCVESPESWFEDFGKGQLDCGCADVTIDPDFAAVTLLDDYHVFLTQYDGMDVLSVGERTPHGFRVAANDPTSTTRFSWRIVAKRKDIPAPRFDTVTVPTEPVLPSIPEPVLGQPPQIHDIRQRSRQQRK
jgi:hypothetical protein